MWGYLYALPLTKWPVWVCSPPLIESECLGTPSPRKKRNNSTPTKDNFAEKSQILHQLITPSANQQPSHKSSLGELIHLTERKINEAEKYKERGESETTFIGSAPLFDLHSPVILDSKLEKKVTFARLLSKVSAEMSSGSEVEHVNKHPSLLNRSNSTPPSPAAGPKSPHSTSSNQGSDSMSSIDVTLTSTNARLSESFANRSSNHLLHGGLSFKNHSADSILAMFRNFSSAPIASNQKPSTSTTPTTSSPQDDVAGSDESSTSSYSFTMDSPPFLPTFHRHTIQVPVLDAISAHKDTGEGSNLLHPPTILLEIPRLSTSKCLSPIREVPTPSLSPALTPILPRSHTYQDEEEKLDQSIIEAKKTDAKDINCFAVTAILALYYHEPCAPGAGRSLRDDVLAGRVGTCRLATRLSAPKKERILSGAKRAMSFRSAREL
uniref:(California timema) hypothetical protein n=1 Tax=Timema californicum TaxID=61474 RepID=A0A7R9P9Z4_TIMCA|nr:unnamed protein product [Timema californicum]